MNIQKIKNLISAVSSFTLEIEGNYAYVKDQNSDLLRKFKIDQDREIDLDKLNDYISRLDYFNSQMNSQDLDKQTQAYYCLLTYILSHKNVIECKQDRDRNFYYFLLAENEQEMRWVSEYGNDHRDLIYVTAGEEYVTDEVNLEWYEAYDNTDEKYVLLENGSWLNINYATWLENRSEWAHDDDVVSVVDDDDQELWHINDVEEDETGDYYAHGLPENLACGLINGRHQNNTWKKLGRGAFLGIEIEGQSSVETLKEVSELEQVNSLQEDSSISADIKDIAYEVVSQILDIKNARILAEKLIALKDFIGADDGGIHIHVSSSKLSEQKWDSLAQFMVDNKEFFVNVAGRESSYAKFRHTYNDRYVMLNFTNSKTRELRIFNNDVSNILEYVNFTYLLVKFFDQNETYDIQNLINFMHEADEALGVYLASLGYDKMDEVEREVASLERELALNNKQVIAYSEYVNNTLFNQLNDLAYNQNLNQVISISALVNALNNNLRYNAFSEILQNTNLLHHSDAVISKVKNYLNAFKDLNIKIFPLTFLIDFLIEIASLERPRSYVQDSDQVYAHHILHIAQLFVQYQQVSGENADQVLVNIIASKFNLDKSDVAFHIPQLVDNYTSITALRHLYYTFRDSQRSDYFSVQHTINMLKSRLNYILSNELVNA